MEQEELTIIDESIYSLMKKMNVDDKLIIPLAEAKHARVYATYLKETADMIYSVNRMHTGKAKMDYLLIRRTK